MYDVEVNSSLSCKWDRTFDCLHTKRLRGAFPVDALTARAASTTFAREIWEQSVARNGVE